MDGNTRSIWTALVDIVTAGIAESGSDQGRLVLFPNPTGSTVQIRCEGGSSLPADLAVTDVQGRIIRRFAGGSPLLDGRTALWDGADASGRPVQSGIYFVTGRGIQSARLTVLR